MNRDPRRLRLILVLLVLTSFTLITIDFKAGKSGPLGAVRRVVSAVVDPIASGVSSVFRPVGHFFSDLGHAGSNGHKVRTLQQQVDQLNAQIASQGDVRRQAQELAELKTLAAGQRFSIKVAQVVAIGDASGFDDTVTINLGSGDGVQPSMTVIAGSTLGGGLVGRVVATTAHTAQVAVIIDPGVQVGARLRGNGKLARVTGNGLAPLTLVTQDQSVVLKKGDVVESFGSGTYAPGIPIGTVISVSATPGQPTITAQVQPFIDYQSLEVVGVVFQPAPGGTDRPVVPTATVTATVTVTAPPTTPTGPTTGGTAGSTPAGTTTRKP